MYMIKTQPKDQWKSWEVLTYCKMGTSIEEVSKLFNRDNAAVLIDLGRKTPYYYKIRYYRFD
jgi:hypothetical protein